MESQRDYLQRRADEEDAAAGRASSDKARDLHKELAARYRAAASEELQLRTVETPKPGLPTGLRILER